MIRVIRGELLGQFVDGFSTSPEDAGEQGRQSLLWERERGDVGSSKVSGEGNEEGPTRDVGDEEGRNSVIPAGLGTALDGSGGEVARASEEPMSSGSDPSIINSNDSVFPVTGVDDSRRKKLGRGKSLLFNPTARLYSSQLRSKYV
ncbi:hypothetical protein PIB30_058073 [Stylosanthes scabra]|uniref:Uncharacterized protein n=1 Tax=Stylosanthes scabra TaxID=79078 RepID=A0ABU6RK49_9FABA|nr:hypothetical protein [Stylosanthes scabra]